MEKRVKSGLTLLLFLAIALVSTFGLQMSTYANPASNWLEGWSYRKSHAIQNAAGAGTNYQIKIITHYGSGTDGGTDVYLNSYSQTDFDDVRFTDDDKVTVLAYWRQSYVASDKAIFWVQVSDDLSSSDQTIYVYYGNSEVSTTSTEFRENLATYTKVDPNNHITLTGDFQVNHHNYENEDAYLYKEFGSDYFKSNAVEFESQMDTGKNCIGVGGAFSNEIDDRTGWADCSGFSPYLRYGQKRLEIYYVSTLGTYALVWNENVIIQGAWYYYTLFVNSTYIVLEIYSDSDRTTLLDTLSCARDVDDDYQYFYATATYYNGQADNCWYYYRNYHIRYYVYPEPAHASWGVEARPHDVAVTNITVSPSEVVVGEPVSIDVAVENQGDFTETFEVSAWYDDTILETKMDITLVAGATATLAFTWDTTGVAEGTYTMKAEASPVPDEHDPSDNVLVWDDVVTVKMIASAISISADPAEVTVGEPTAIRGYITPVRSGATVTIWHRPSGELMWNILTTVATDQDSRYSYVWVPSTEGVYELRVDWPGDEKTLPAESPVVTLEVCALTLSIKLCGEHDYLLMEDVKVRLGALVKDAASMEPVSNADVTIVIYDADGGLWVSDTMVERIAGTGIYEWESAETIRLLRLEKGVYLAHVTASLQAGQTASDILEFHVDPPQEQPIEPKAILLVAMVGVAMIASAWYIDHRRLTKKLAHS